MIKEVKEFLSQSFEMKDLGESDVILNIKLVKESNGGVILTQSHYVEKVLSRFGYSDYKPSSAKKGMKSNIKIFYSSSFWAASSEVSSSSSESMCSR